MSDEPEKIVYLVRHGESIGNATRVFQPASYPLSDKGKEQAEKIAERIANISFETLIASPMVRSKETAEAISKATGKQPEFSDLFAEFAKPTSLEGKSYDDPDADRLWREWQDTLYTPKSSQVEDGENYEDIIERIEAALDLLKSRPEKELVVVTHSFFMRSLIAHVLFAGLLTPETLGSFLSQTMLVNTGLSVLRYGALFDKITWRLSIYNDHAHLG